MTEDPHIRVRRTDKPYDGGDYVRLERRPTITGVVARLALCVAVAFIAARCAEPAHETSAAVQP